MGEGAQKHATAELQAEQHRADSRDTLLQIASTRSYATGPAGASSSSNLAPILLGLGLAGAGGFYYSTLDSKKVPGQTGITKTPGPSALSNDEFR